MSRFLMLDIGAGTLDLLVYDTDTGEHYKAVVRSPVQYLAEQVERLTGKLLITGGEMGGGPISNVLKEKYNDQDNQLAARLMREGETQGKIKFRYVRIYFFFSGTLSLCSRT
ncbi:MAG: hypothetical protein R6U38_02620, partial [Desulfatiglandaceae bacterium]